jgi:hypothetical protein
MLAFKRIVTESERFVMPYKSQKGHMKVVNVA